MERLRGAEGRPDLIEDPPAVESFRPYPFMRGRPLRVLERRSPRPGIRAASDRVPCRIFREPLRNAGHFVFESSGTVDVEDPRTFVRSILEVMHNPAGNENEGTLGSINPLLVDQDGHRSFDDVPDVVLIVGVCVRPLGIRLQPPFGDGIGPSCFSVVCLENCGYATHGIGASVAGKKKNWFASLGSRFAHTPLCAAGRSASWKKDHRVRSDAVEPSPTAWRAARNSCGVIPPSRRNSRFMCGWS